MRNVLLIAMLLLSGCSTYDLTLMSRTSGASGSGAAKQIDNSVQITLNDVVYRGKYTYSTGGSASFGTMTATSGTATAFGGGTGISLSGGGHGNILARSLDGKGLRCVFQYSGWQRSGSGVCQDDAGLIYDLQIG